MEKKSEKTADSSSDGAQEVWAPHIQQEAFESLHGLLSGQASQW